LTLQRLTNGLKVFSKLNTILKSFLSYTINCGISFDNPEGRLGLPTPRSPNMSSTKVPPTSVLFVGRLESPERLSVKFPPIDVGGGDARRLFSAKRLLLLLFVATIEGLGPKSSPPNKSRRLFAFAISVLTADC